MDIMGRSYKLISSESLMVNVRIKFFFNKSLPPLIAELVTG